MVLVAGVDEAGRGSVIGPLIIAGVLFHSHQIPKLLNLGVRDSKTLTPKHRQRLSNAIEEMSIKCVYADINPPEIDHIVLTGKRLHKLNLLEAKAMASVIQQLAPDVVYVDAADVIEGRFGDQIKQRLDFSVGMVSEHKADVKYPVVSAASIVAKVRRDKAIDQLREKYGVIGSGYSHDPKTCYFLLDLIKKNEPLPEFVRKSWKTIKRLSEKAKQCYL